MPDRELLFSVTPADCEMHTFRSGGPGGQNQNKRDTGVRFVHPPSGARGESREHRTQLENKKAAWHKMAKHPLFAAWVARQSDVYKKIEAAAQKWAAEQVEDPAAIKVEVFDGKRWVTVTSTSDD